VRRLDGTPQLILLDKGLREAIARSQLLKTGKVCGCCLDSLFDRTVKRYKRYANIAPESDAG